MSRGSDFLKFVAFVVLASIAFGIAHDLVTSQVAPAYFLPPYHPEIIASNSPIMLALTWGVVATWWMGLILGSIIGLVNVLGPEEPVRWARVRTKVVATLSGIWMVAMLMLVVTYFTAPKLVTETADSPHERAIHAVSVTHLWSYLLSAAGAFWVARWVRVSRVDIHPFGH